MKSRQKTGPISRYLAWCTSREATEQERRDRLKQRLSGAIPRGTCQWLREECDIPIDGLFKKESITVLITRRGPGAKALGLSPELKGTDEQLRALQAAWRGAITVTWQWTEDRSTLRISFKRA